MFRTRDFVLVFSAIVFLLAGIGATLLSKSSLSFAGSVPSEVMLAQVSGAKRTAELSPKEEINRADRLAEMRKKVAASQDVWLAAAPEPEDDVVEDEVLEESADDVTTDEVVVAASEPQQCPGYYTFASYWPLGGLSFEVAEGARIVYEEVAGLVAEPTRTVYAQLPLGRFPASATHCLPTDVVGIAQDGSLIRNTEAGLYSVFGEQTLIGYALDGNPIYGVSGLSTDSCGGTLSGGEYRYYLSDDRETILNCFSSAPITL